MPFKDVAEECGVSRAAIHQRVQRLIDMNIITGSGYTVNPKCLVFRCCIHRHYPGARFDVQRSSGGT